MQNLVVKIGKELRTESFDNRTVLNTDRQKKLTRGSLQCVAQTENLENESIVKYTDIAVRSLTCHTATGTHMPYRITVLPATRQR